MRAKIRGIELYYDVDGMGLAPDDERMVERPTILVLHGGPGGDHSSFKTQVTSQLTDVAQLVYVDHRGSGRSIAPDVETNTLDNNIDDLEALREHLGLERVGLLGSSYGGMVSQGYAIRYPERVSNLILVATAPSHHFLDDAKTYVKEQCTPDQQRVCDWLWNGTFESDEQLHEYYRQMGPLYSMTFDADAFEKSWERGIRNYAQLNLGFTTFLTKFDFRAELESVPCPALVLGGAHDWICAAKHSVEIAKRLPRAHLKIFAKSGHSIASDEPHEFLNAVRGFLTYAPS